MTRRSTLLLLMLLCSPALAQLPLPPSPAWPPAEAVPASIGLAAPITEASAAPAGTQGFSNFIGFMSNPVQNIDPRSLTQIFPIFLGVKTDEFGPLPAADFQVYGAGISVALTDRLSVGLNQGGFAAVHTGPVNARRRIGERVAARRGLGNDSRTGFLNTGGFVQYTFIADEESQLLFTAGTRVELPIGSYEVFQGKGPAYLAPYATVGKGFGNFHFLATAGYEFPARVGDGTTRTFNFNGHLDYQLCDWIYPLVEVNWSRSTSSTDVDIVTRRGFVSLGNFDTTGEVVTLALGVNFVLIRDRLEIGGCYGTPVYTKRDFDFDTVLVKMIIRY
ncbi:MAG: hypothetical protein ACRC33_07835 [Gemmataceae bacterium]